MMKKYQHVKCFLQICVLRVCRKLSFRKFFTSGTYCTLSLNGTFWRPLAHCNYDGVIHSATKKISDQNGLIQEIL